MIVLLNPNSNVKYSNSEPLGLYYIASNLINNHYTVKIIDLYNSHTLADLKRFILQNEVLLLGITTCAPSFYEIISLCQIVKNYSPQTKIMLGGPHASAKYQEILKTYLEVDFVCIGPGEHSVVQLLEYLNGRCSFAEVYNIAQRSAGLEIICNIKHEKQLNDCPDAVRELVIKEGRFTKAAVASTRGCPYQCSFCYSAFSGSRKWYCRSILQVLHEIQGLKDNRHVNCIVFSDSDFLASTKRAVSILEKWDQQLTFRFATRVDSLLKFSEYLDLLFEKGCDLIELGIESGSQKQLERYHKMVTVAMNERALQILNEKQKRYSFQVNLDMIFFDYHMQFEEIRENVDFLKRNKIDIVGYEKNLFTKLDYIPGSPSYDEAVSKQEIIESLSIPFSYFRDPRVGTVYTHLLAYEELLLPNVKKLREKIKQLIAGDADQSAKIHLIHDLHCLNQMSYSFLNELAQTAGERPECLKILEQYELILQHFYDLYGD